MLIIEISVAAVSVAFLVGTVFFIRTLLILSKTAATFERTLRDLGGKAEEALEESAKTLQETRHFVGELREKTQQADRLLRSADELGQSLGEVVRGISRAAEANRKRLGNVVALIGAGVELVNKLRKG